MNIEFIFPTPIWTVGCNFDLEVMQSYIADIKEQSSGKKVSNRGGWQSNDYLKNDLNDQIFNSFFKYTEKNLMECFRQYGCPNKPKIDNIWFNINASNNYNLPHTHVGSFLSGVFYVNVPENSGNIVFVKDSAEDYNIISHVGKSSTRLSASLWRYTPIPNQLIIFPGWLNHYVEKNNSSEDRISISFNVIGEPW